MTAIRTAESAPTGAAALAALAAHLSAARGRSGYLTAPNTIKAYLSSVAAVVDPAASVAVLDTEPGAAALRGAIVARWGSAAATFNARRAALAAFIGFCRDRSWIASDPLASLPGSSQPKRGPRARSRAEVDRLLRNSRAGVVCKGSAPDIVTWDRGGLTARLLARYLGVHTRGPLFLTVRAAKGNAGPAGLDPDTGRVRYGYDAALIALKKATGGWTLHDLRHSG
ncbi:hypothetical protein [Amycolatopsis orientalis]|uniref:hypothetical protein n=1 Tax=Amycolatopsis orientalis TaxID=31958 RepID=UPI0003F7BAF3|nr:hypothetical protein [Amycolatopsis orientalis]